jgi:hypothetical protein
MGQFDYAPSFDWHLHAADPAETAVFGMGIAIMTSNEWRALANDSASISTAGTCPSNAFLIFSNRVIFIFGHIA